MLTFRSIGSAVGTAMSGAVYKSKLAQVLPNRILEAARSSGVSQESIPIVIQGISSENITLAEKADGVSASALQAAQNAALEAYSYSFHYVWFVSIPFLALCFISLCLLTPIHKPMNSITERPIDGNNHRRDHDTRNDISRTEECEPESA